MCGDLFPCTVDRVISRWIENKSGEKARLVIREVHEKAYATGVFKTKLQAITSSFYRI